ncbi:hypothetical protein EGW08_004702 [Elysia chlorotica]|uniref:Uncharacterized protein n=1 Tax=Elysia chlorotica TaxID=188477 RepID=A0A433U143_ELYCH|nr:hypothetical protein EGW08_004702 [Elysia chlorotica]
MNLKLVSLCLVVSVLAGSTLATQVEDFARVLQQVSRTLERIPKKRVCQGYMCSYGHNSDSASKAAVHKVLLHYLYQCAMDNTCHHQGKRRRRSSSASAPSSVSSNSKMSLRKLTQYKSQNSARD